MSILVTQSLYGAIKFYENANEQWRTRAEKSLRNILARDYSEPMPEPVKRGIDFENAVYNILSRSNSDKESMGSEYFRAIVKACENGRVQEKVKFFLVIDDVEYCMYGKIDILKPELIIDLKVTGHWNRFSEDKYFNSMQHHMYCFGKKIPDFEYHIAVIPENTLRIQQYKIIPYKAMTWEEEENYLIRCVKYIRDFLAANKEYDTLWKNTYSLY